jgi:hypothetical protein
MLGLSSWILISALATNALGATYGSLYIWDSVSCDGALYFVSVLAVVVFLLAGSRGTQAGCIVQVPGPGVVVIPSSFCGGGDCRRRKTPP